MPNHCSNKLTVTGDSENLIEFSEFMKTDTEGQVQLLDLNKICPEPDHGEETDGCKWYNWRNTNWGTKWGCYETQVQRNANELTYTFQTAWSPFRYSIFTKMINSFPKLQFRLIYAEQGMEFIGEYNHESQWSKSDGIRYTPDESNNSDECHDLIREYEEWEDLWMCSG